MGNLVSHVAHDEASYISPWQTTIRFENRTKTPVYVFLARDYNKPRAKHAARYEVPGESMIGISSGWWHKDQATLLVRTGLQSAVMIRAGAGGRIVAELLPHGLSITAPDAHDLIVFEDYADWESVPGHDTVPMVMRGEHFHDNWTREGSLDRVESWHSLSRESSSFRMGREGSA